MTGRPLSSVAVFCGASRGNNPEFARVAAHTGRVLASRGIDVVFGGSHLGLMGTVADAALAAGGRVTGVIPRALFERERVHGELSELVVVDSMHERKREMSERADAFIALPGGPGTLEEITEQWTWAQLGIHDKPVALFNVDGYFDPLLAFVENMRDRGFTHPRYTDMLIVATGVDEALTLLQAYEPPARTAVSPGAELTAQLRP